MGKNIHFQIQLDSNYPDKNEQIRFGGQANSVISYCSTFFKIIKGDNIDSFKIILKPDNASDELLHPPSDLSKYVIVYLKYDYDKFYLNATNEEKKRQLIVMLRKAIEFVLNEVSINKQPYEEALAKIDSLDFQFKGFYIKPKLSPDRKYKASIEYNIDATGIQYSVVFRSKTELIELPLVSLNTDGTIMSGFDVTHILNEAEWLNDGVFEIRDRASEIFFSCNVETKEITMEIKPQNPKDLQWLKDKFEIATTTDEARKKELARKFK